MSVEHGTHQGRNWHTLVSHTPLCEACREFTRNYARERRRALGSRISVTFPTELTFAYSDGAGLGAAIARGIRESA